MHLLGLAFLLLWPDSADFDRIFQQGLTALNENHLPEAGRNLGKAAELQPDNARVCLALAQLHWKTGQQQVARGEAEKAEKLGKGNPVILHGLAVFYFEAREFARAAALEEQYAAQAPPQDRGAIARAISLYLDAGDPRHAVTLARKALATEDRADLHNLLGKAFEADGQSQQSVPELERAIQMNLYEEAYYFDLAQVLLIHQKFDVAVKVLEGGRRIFAKSPQLELALGVAYYGQRRFSDAVESFLRTAALAPQIEQPYIFLGRIIDQAEARMDEVTDRFAAFAKSNPESYLANFLYAKVLLAGNGDGGNAEALLRKSIGLNPRYWESHFQLGVVLERKRDFAAAAQELQRAIELDPKNPTPHYRLARIYDRLNQPARARAERAVHEKLSAEEKAAIDRHAAGVQRLELVVK